MLEKLSKNAIAKVFFFIVYFFLSTPFLNSQVVFNIGNGPPFPDLADGALGCCNGPNCSNVPCTANDFTFDSLYIAMDVNGSSFPTSCTSGTILTGYFCFVFTNNTTSARTGIYIEGDITVDGIVTYHVSHTSNISPPAVVGMQFLVCIPFSFDFICNDNLAVQNLFFAWDSAGDDLATATRCQDWPGSKCIKDELIDISEPCPINNITGRDTTLCQGQSVDLSTLLNGVVFDSLSFGTTFGSWNNDNVVTPSLGMTTYFVRDSSFGVNACVDTAQITVTIIELPAITGRDTAICNGESIDLLNFVNGNIVNTLEVGTTFGNYNIINTVVSPSTTTVYFIRDSSATTLCLDTARIILTVNDLPTCLIGGATMALNNSQADYMGPAGMSAYLWQVISGDASINGANNTQIATIDFGTVNSTIQLTIIDNNGCSSTCTIDVTITNSISCMISGPTTTCANTTGLMFSSIAGATTYNWDISSGDAIIEGPANQTMVTVNAGSNNFTVRVAISPGSNSPCTFDVTINDNPSASPINTEVCVGSTVMIAGNATAGSGTIDSHSWTVDNAGGTGASIANLTNFNTSTVTFNAAGLSSGTVTLEYIVSDDNGCSDISRVQVTINNLPAITGRDTSICNGETVDLNTLINGTVLGTLAYGETFGNYSSTQQVSPTFTTTYFIRDSVVLTGCVDTAQVTIIINDLPAITGRDTSICNGETVDLNTLINGTVLGTLAYGETFGNYSSTQQVSPTFTTTYFIRDSVVSTGCIDTAQVTIIINDLPAITGRDTSICEEQTFNLASLINGTTIGTVMYGSSIGNYTNAITDDVTVSTTTTFIIRDSVTATGCVDTAVINININCNKIVSKPIPIPTMSEWGLIIFGLLILNLGGIFVYRLSWTLAISAD